MSRDGRMVLAIDVGTSKVRVIAARAMQGNDFEIAAVGQSVSRGVKRGIVQEVDDASLSVAAAIDAAGLVDKLQSAEVYASVGGKHIGSIAAQGEVDLARGGSAVTEKDLDRAMIIARDATLADGRQRIHSIASGFRIDGYRCRQNPVGMGGSIVQADAHIVTGDAGAISKLVKAIQMAGRHVQHLACSAVAASNAAARQDEKEAGVVCMDIGGGTTGVVVYEGGVIRHNSVLPLGGNQIANDIAIALGTSFSVGEEVLQEQAHGTMGDFDPNEELTVPCLGMNGYRRFRRQYLQEVVRLRLTELLQLGMAQATVGRTGAGLAAGLVLTGGVSNLPGLEGLARQLLEIPVRIGYAPARGDSPEGLQNPSFAAIIGMIQLEAELSEPSTEGRLNGSHGGLRQFLHSIPMLDRKRSDKAEEQLDPVVGR